MEKFIRVLCALCISITVVSGTFFALHFIIFMKMMSVVISADPPASILITISTDFLMEVANARNHSTFIRSRISFPRPLSLPLFQPSFPILLFIVFSLHCPLVVFALICFHSEHSFFSSLALRVGCVARRVCYSVD